MPVPFSGVVGPTAANGGDGSPLPIRQGHTGDIIASEFMPRYTELMLRGQSFSVANQAAQAVSAALATSYTGLMLYNPIGSGVILIPLNWKFALSVAPAAISTIGLLNGSPTAVPSVVTEIQAQCNQIGNASRSTGRVFTAATLVSAPTWLKHALDGAAAAAFPAVTPPIEADGKFGVLPGSFIAIGALTAVTGLGHISWAEIPYNLQG